MKRYRIKFSNTHTFILHGHIRKDVLDKAIRATKGLISDAQQRENLEFCTLIRS